MNRKAIYIRWRDSSYIYQAGNVRDIDKRVMIIESIGFLISESSDAIVIAQDWDNEDEIRCLTCIPTENVVDKKILEL